MDSYLVFDLVILAFILLLVWRGAKRGLILTLCSLLAVVIAFLGADAVSTVVSPLVAERITPVIESALTARVDESLPSFDFGADDLGDANGDAANTDAADSNVPDSADVSVTEDTLALLGDSMTARLIQLVSDELGLFADNARLTLTEFLSSISVSIALRIASAAVFLVCFVVILLVWAIIAHALDLVARLPGLHFLNKTGGAIFGGLKAVVVLFVLAWVFRNFWHVIPEDAAKSAPILRFFMNTDPLEYIFR